MQSLVGEGSGVCEDKNWNTVSNFYHKGCAVAELESSVKKTEKVAEIKSYIDRSEQNKGIILYGAISTLEPSQFF
jgi:hypothetical protein